MSYGQQVLKNTDIKSGLQKIINKAGEKIDSLKAELSEKNRELEFLRKKVFRLDASSILGASTPSTLKFYSSFDSDLKHESINIASKADDADNGFNLNAKRTLDTYNKSLHKLSTNVEYNCVTTFKRQKLSSSKPLL